MPLIMFSMKCKSKFPFDKVVGISGSGQQHGSVYWSGEANELLNDLIPCKNYLVNYKMHFHGGIQIGKIILL